MAYSWVFIDGRAYLTKGIDKGWFHYKLWLLYGCLQFTYNCCRVIDQSSMSAIVAPRVGPDYIALIMITIFMTQKYVINYN